MTELDQFAQDLEEALEAREAELRETTLPALKQCYVRMNSSFEALHTLLLKKGLVKSDPYGFEERISEITIPSDQPFLESEREREMSVRTAQYGAQLAFVINYYDFSLEHLDLRELKKLSQFTRYLNWQNLSETATQPTTRALGEQVSKVKRGSDQLSVNIATDAQEQLDSASREALDHLKRITACKRERYKLDVRRRALPAAGLTREISSPEAAVQKVRSAWQGTMAGQPFARELVLEVFQENSGSGGEAARRVLLETLRTAAPRAKKVRKAEPDLRETLLESTRALASCSRSLEDTVQKLNDNAMILENRKLSFGEMLRAIWKRLRSGEEDGHVYAVEYIDEKTGMRKAEEIRFEEFVNGLSRRARVYNGILSRSGSAWTKLQQSKEEELLQFVTRDLQELTLALRRIESLDTMFRGEIDREQRKRLRGVNAEIALMRENTQRARKKNHEYVSRYEEIEQLKRLGIDPTD
ncbi:MAG: hypothetical protein EA427_04320 [Spirochaetaceae bacterium]|nr:MAG: hypothetical protein EA427_04320 [Spirochaetaceae bacterium]